MLAALMIFHALLLRQFITAIVYRRFDLSGGPREYYEFRIDNNVNGVFGRQKPVPCDSAACENANPVSKMKLVDDEKFLEYKNM